MSDLINRLKKLTSIKKSDVLETTTFFDLGSTPTPVYGVNIAYGGNLFEGFGPGLHFWAGPSKHFKSLFSLISVKAYMDQNPDSICIFYDSEFGSPKTYWKSLKIDMNRVIHVPITDIEELKFDIMKKLDKNSEDSIQDSDKVIIFVDSVGNLASKKEVEDALKESGAADMTRAKQLKSLWRMVTPYLTIKDIPMIVVNHTYSSMELYSKEVMGGGTGGMYSANSVFIISKAQVKDADGLAGFKFTINIEKSRTVKEKSKIPVIVRFDESLNPVTGLFEIAFATGDIVRSKVGWYKPVLVDKETGELIENDKAYRQGDFDDPKIWEEIMFKQTMFPENVIKNYKLSSNDLIGESDFEV